MAKREREELRPDDGLTTKLVSVNRISKTVKGGRNMRFAALVVVGDGKGKVGYGTGKATEVAFGTTQTWARVAKHAMFSVSIAGDTIPHKTNGNFGKSNVLLLPAPEGTGVIAGSSVRAVVELVGIKNITTKCYGSRNPINCVKATINGLKSLRTIDQVAALRGKTVEEILG